MLDQDAGFQLKNHSLSRTSDVNGPSLGGCDQWRGVCNVSCVSRQQSHVTAISAARKPPHFSQLRNSFARLLDLVPQQPSNGTCR
jgi:hypothetical protein